MEHDLGPAEALAEGGMRAVEVAGEQILLVRHAGRCHAVGARCPHAGGPLDQGVLHEGVVTCPWHKAAFEVTTGKRVEPPAVDDLPRYTLREDGGRLLATPEPRRHTPARLGSDSKCFVILGAGAAGAAAAQTLREEGFAGRVVLVGREDRLPYDRTVLSKYALSGKQGGEKSPLQDAFCYANAGIERLVADAVQVDPATRSVTFADRTQLAYDALLLATGGVPKPLDVPGADLPGVHLLRTQADAEAIVRSAAGAKRAVVIGAGYIGLEAAASLRERGLEVAVVAPQRAPLEKQLGAEIGNAFRRVHERQGVVFHLGEATAAIEGEGKVERVRLASGADLPADLVVAGLGIAPATRLLQGIELRPDQGLDVDAQLRVQDGLYAAGDIAAFPLYGDGARIRVEHWRVAQQHGRVAALNMLGRGVAYDAVPFFWTIHFMKRLDYAGHAERWDEIVVDGDLEKPEFLAFYVQDGVVRAVAGWDRDREMAQIVHFLTQAREWSVAKLRSRLSR